MKNSKRSSSKSSRQTTRSGNERSESVAVEAVTAVWALTVLNTFACELGAVVAGWIARYNPPAPVAGMLSGLLLFAALIIGLLSLGLLPIILKIRSHRPPYGVIIFAILIGTAPILALLLMIARK